MRNFRTYSAHDGHQLREWTAEDEKSFFNPDFLRRVWFISAIKSQADVDSPEEFFLCPALFADKFPDERKIEIAPDLRARIDAQEKLGGSCLAKST